VTSSASPDVTAEPTGTPTWRRFVPQRIKELYRRIYLAGETVAGIACSRRSARAALDLGRAVYRAAPLSFLDSRQLYSTDRLFVLDRLVRELDERGIAGDIVECGVYRGGSASILARAAKDSPFPRELWLFDSFEGLPEPTAPDGADMMRLAGQLAVPETIARDVVARSGLSADRTHFVTGWFEQTLPQTRTGPVALLHIDADFYEPIRLCLERFYDDVVPGGVIVLDDYAWFPGCRAALHELLQNRNDRVELIFPPGIDISPYFIKPSARAR
jgi:O-methyltransferase